MHNYMDLWCWRLWTYPLVYQKKYLEPWCHGDWAWMVLHGDWHLYSMIILMLRWQIQRALNQSGWSGHGQSNFHPEAYTLNSERGYNLCSAFPYIILLYQGMWTVQFHTMALFPDAIHAQCCWWPQLQSPENGDFLRKLRACKMIDRWIDR